MSFFSWFKQKYEEATNFVKKVKGWVTTFIEVQMTLALGVGVGVVIWFAGSVISSAETVIELPIKAVESLYSGFSYVVDFLADITNTSRSLWQLGLFTTFLLFFTEATILLVDVELKSPRTAFFWKVFDFFTSGLKKVYNWLHGKFSIWNPFRYILTAIYWVILSLFFVTLCLLNLLNPWYWMTK